MRVAFTDGEMSNLQADFGQLLCACIIEFRPLSRRQLVTGRKPWMNPREFVLDQYKGKRWDDRGLALRWRDAIEEYDRIVTWNGIKFDLPFLESRLRRWGLRGPAVKRHRDLMYTARYKMQLHSASLDSVSTHLRIHEKYGIGKTKLEPERWTMAMGGHERSYYYILQHCRLDVKVLAAVYQEIKHLIPEDR